MGQRGSVHLNANEASIEATVSDALKTFETFLSLTMKDAIILQLEQGRVASTKPKKKPPVANVMYAERVAPTFINDDAYIVYAIYVNVNDSHSVTYRRFKEFQLLHKSLPPDLRSLAKLPAPSSKFGSRNLSRPFVSMRLTSLSSYLDTVCNYKGSHDIVSGWLGYTQDEDPLFGTAFSLALRLTLNTLSIPKNIRYDAPLEALKEMTSQHVVNMFWGNLSPSLDNRSPKSSKHTIKEFYSSTRRETDKLTEDQWQQINDTTSNLFVNLKDIAAAHNRTILSSLEVATESGIKVLEKPLQPITEELSFLTECILVATKQPLHAVFTDVEDMILKFGQILASGVTCWPGISVNQMIEMIYASSQNMMKSIDKAVQSIEQASEDLADRSTISPIQSVLSKGTLRKLSTILDAFKHATDLKKLMGPVLSIASRISSLFKCKPKTDEDIQKVLNGLSSNTQSRVQDRMACEKSIENQAWQLYFRIDRLPQLHPSLAQLLRVSFQKIAVTVACDFPTAILDALKASLKDCTVDHWHVSHIEATFKQTMLTVINRFKKTLYTMFNETMLSVLAQDIAASSTEHILAMLKDNELRELSQDVGLVLKPLIDSRIVIKRCIKRVVYSTIEKALEIHSS